MSYSFYLLTHKKGLLLWLGRGTPTQHTGQNSLLRCVTTNTAESLDAEYQAALANLKITDKDVDVLAVAVGPGGSFTGLRLGCAFANGLHLGRPRKQLLALRTSLSPSDDRGVLQHSGYVQEEDFWDVLRNPVQEVQQFLAEYERDPSPVIRMKQGLLRPRE